MRTEIFIEGIQLDLSKDISSEYSFSIDDVKDFASRNTSYSKTIVIPGNATNNKIFGHIFQFGSSNPYNPNVINVGNNFNAAKSAACIVFIEKTQIFKGILRLLEIIIDGDAIEYECVVFGELGGFVSAMGNARLEDLDMSVINGNNISHNWTLSNATQSWDNASGYYYPLIDYGNCSTNKHDWDIKALRPALYVKDYVDKIFEFTGYTYESTFFNTDLFKRLIIPNNSKQLLKQTTALVRASYSFVSNNWLNINAGSTLTVVKDITYSSYTLSNFTSNGTNFTSTNVDPITGSFAIFVAGAITVTTNGGGNMYAYCKLYKNNVLLYQFPTVSYVLFSGTQTRQMYFNGTPTDTINQNDTYRVEISVNIQMFPPNSVSSGYVTLYNASLNIDSNVAVIAPLNYGDAIDINSLIPKGIFMREFIASLVKMFNLYIVESREKSKHLIIKPFITFYVQDAELLLHSDDLFKVDNNDFLLLRDGSGIALDWTYKVDRSKPIRLKPMSEINGRYFEYKYKPDNDYYNEQYQKKYTQGYGDTIVDTGYEFAKEKQTAEVIFAATPLVGYTGEDKIYPTILKITNSNVSPKVEESTDHVVRIMQRKKVTGVNNYDVKNGATVLGTLNTYGYAGHLDDPDLPLADINFGAPNELYFSGVSNYPSANLYNGYWSEYVAEISDKDSKLLTCNVKLNNVDIYNLNFTFLIFIDGALWRLNKIIDYNPNEYETTKVELLKVIELSYV